MFFNQFMREEIKSWAMDVGTGSLYQRVCILRRLERAWILASFAESGLTAEEFIAKLSQAVKSSPSPIETADQVRFEYRAVLKCLDFKSFESNLIRQFRNDPRAKVAR